MKIDAVRLAQASAIVIALLWTICSGLAAFLPSQIMAVSGHMIHADMEMMSWWAITWTGFFIGLIAWSVLAAITTWLIAISSIGQYFYDN